MKSLHSSKKKGVVKKEFEISYWQTDDIEANSEDYDVDLACCITDVLTGDLFFMN